MHHSAPLIKALHCSLHRERRDCHLPCAPASLLTSVSCHPPDASNTRPCSSQSARPNCRVCAVDDASTTELAAMAACQLVQALVLAALLPCSLDEASQRPHMAAPAAIEDTHHRHERLMLPIKYGHDSGWRRMVVDIAGEPLQHLVRQGWQWSELLATAGAADLWLPATLLIASEAVCMQQHDDGQGGAAGTAQLALSGDQSLLLMDAMRRACGQLTQVLHTGGAQAPGQAQPPQLQAACSEHMPGSRGLSDSAAVRQQACVLDCICACAVHAQKGLAPDCAANAFAANSSVQVLHQEDAHASAWSFCNAAAAALCAVLDARGSEEPSSIPVCPAALRCMLRDAQPQHVSQLLDRVSAACLHPCQGSGMQLAAACATGTGLAGLLHHRQQTPALAGSVSTSALERECRLWQLMLSALRIAGVCRSAPAMPLVAHAEQTSLSVWHT